MRKSKRSPSRIKYEETHRTFSFRVSKELYDRLEAVKKAESLSNTDIVTAGLGLYKVKVKAEEEVRREAYDKGWEKGNEEASNLYAVTYPCSKCRKEMTVTTDEEKKAIREFMVANGWQHCDCSDPWA